METSKLRCKSGLDDMIAISNNFTHGIQGSWSVLEKLFITQKLCINHGLNYCMFVISIICGSKIDYIPQSILFHVRGEKA